MPKFTAKNSLDAREIFERRLDYKWYAYSEPTTNTTTPQPNRFPANTQDFWLSEIAFYGRVSANNISEPMTPYAPYLKSLRSRKGAAHVLNFVADAFKRLQQDYLGYITSGALVSDDQFSPEISAVKGYVPIDRLYHEMQEEFYNIFAGYLKTNNIKHKIQNMDDFLKEIFYLFDLYGGFPFTKSAFIMSRYCSPLISALGVEVRDIPYSDDEPKKKFIDSPNFSCYTNLAAKHGFMIDKNIPWRLMADLNSPAMQSYAQAYEDAAVDPVSISNLFYVQVAVNELDIFKSYILRHYNQFVKENPINITVSHSSAGQTKTRQSRLKMTKEKFNQIYDDSYWLEPFAKIRNMETGIGYSEPGMTAIIRVAKDIQKTLDTASAMGYIKNKFSGVEFFEGSLAHASERIRQINEGSKGCAPNENVTSEARRIRKIFF